MGRRRIARCPSEGRDRACPTRYDPPATTPSPPCFQSPSHAPSSSRNALPPCSDRRVKKGKGGKEKERKDTCARERASSFPRFLFEISSRYASLPPSPFLVRRARTHTYTRAVLPRFSTYAYARGDEQVSESSPPKSLILLSKG